MGLAEDVGGSFAATGERLGVKDATLIKVARGTRTYGSSVAGTNPTATPYTCKGFVSSFDIERIDGTLVQSDDRIVSLFSTTLDSGVVPSTGDRITIEGQTFNIIGGVTRDPASVMYECHCRR